jgi:hypothetical protein
MDQQQFDPTQIHVEAHAPRIWEQEQSFQEIMADQLRHAPWIAISLAVHAIVIGILFMIKLEPNLKKNEIVLQQQRQEQVEQIEEEPEEEPEEPEEEVEPEPVLQDAEVSDHNEDDTEEFNEMEESDQTADSAFDSDAFNDMIGIGGGAGGKFGGRGGGRRRLRTKGGRQTAEAIRLGLEWLKNHQDDDGKWSTSEFMKHCPGDDQCDGPGNPVNDVGITGLALLAFLGDGSTLRGGPYKEVVKKGVLWLRKQQDDEGLIGQESGHAYMYNHAIAALAMVEAYGLSKYMILRTNAQKAINYIAKSRNPYKVWRYYPQDGQNDTSVTGWMVFALNSAKEFKLKVDQDALKFSEAWFDEVTDPSTGQAGYTKRGEPSSRKAGLEDKFPSDKTESLTAVGLLCRIFLGQTPETHPILLTAADTMLRKPPVWNPADGSIDVYYWYYGSYAMFQIGGNHWKQWKKTLNDALVKTQRKEGHAKGSWDPISAWGEDGGRVYATAIGVLCLEVYYRYTRLIR